jgi:hypothetical protein
MRRYFECVLLGFLFWGFIPLISLMYPGTISAGNFFKVRSPNAPGVTDLFMKECYDMIASRSFGMSNEQFNGILKENWGENREGYLRGYQVATIEMLVCQMHMANDFTREKSENHALEDASVLLHPEELRSFFMDVILEKFRDQSGRTVFDDLLPYLQVTGRKDDVVMKNYRDYSLDHLEGNVYVPRLITLSHRLASYEGYEDLTFTWRPDIPESYILSYFPVLMLKVPWEKDPFWHVWEEEFYKRIVTIYPANKRLVSNAGEKFYENVIKDDLVAIFDYILGEFESAMREKLPAIIDAPLTDFLYVAGSDKMRKLMAGMFDAGFYNVAKDTDKEYTERFNQQIKNSEEFYRIMEKRFKRTTY